MKKIVFYLLLLSSYTIAQQWQSLGLSSEGVTSIAVDWSNPNIIYAGSGSDYSSGKVGGIFKSTNAGTTWDTLIRGVTVHEIIIHPKNPNIIFVTLGLNGLTVPGIIKSTNGGNNWQEVDSGMYVTSEEGPSQLIIDYNYPDTMYCGTAGFYGGRFYRSTNGGQSWKSYGDSTRLRNGVVSIAIAPDSSNIIFAGTEFSGDILKSTDYGEDWDTTGFVSDGSIIYSLQFAKTSSTIYAGSSPGYSSTTGIFKSTDGGKTWTNPKFGLPDTASVLGIQIMYDSNETVFLTTGWIYKSISSEPWKKIGSGGTLTLFKTKLYAGSKGVLVSDLVTSINDKERSRPNEFQLVQNYPNPFNPGTNINYELSKSSQVLLEIFDIQGKEIKTLVNKYERPGKYSVYWNGKDNTGIHVSSGVYFYIFCAQGYSVSRKMIYLK
jgi:photosystem II stability/assembly factor-like uncharacterized protein